MHTRFDSRLRSVYLRRMRLRAVGAYSHGLSRVRALCALASATVLRDQHQLTACHAAKFRARQQCDSLRPYAHSPHL